METVGVIISGVITTVICGVPIAYLTHYWNKSKKIVSIIHSIRGEITSNRDGLRNLENYYNTNRDTIDKYQTSTQTGNYDSLRNEIGFLGESISKKISEYKELIDYINKRCMDSSKKSKVSEDCKSKISHVVELGEEIINDLDDLESMTGLRKYILYHSSNIWCSQIEKLYQRCKNKISHR